MGYQVFLKKQEDARIREGHSWVYANEVQRIEGKDKNGSLATVYDFHGTFLGKGYINHLSKILVRVFIRDKATLPDKEFFLERIAKANQRRLALGYSDNYRVVFTEADDLPGLIVDKYNDVLSVQFLSLGMDTQKDLIVECLVDLFAPVTIYERSDVAVREKEGLPLTKGVLYGADNGIAVINENGVKMTVDVANGQKTGYFLDQKDNRMAIRRYSKDKTVLDCFCNAGGFSINAAIGGAASVTSLDVSEKALQDTRLNAENNDVADKITTIKCDVFEKLREYKKDNTTFDVIILDPPAFCKTANEINDAIRGYKDINLLAMKLINSGGYLITASCSYYIDMNLFTKMIKDAARLSKRQIRLLDIKMQASDHPTLLFQEETQYLKFFVLGVE